MVSGSFRKFLSTHRDGYSLRESFFITSLDVRIRDDNNTLSIGGKREILEFFERYSSIALT
jgi:hypothetical protein